MDQRGMTTIASETVISDQTDEILEEKAPENLYDPILRTVSSAEPPMVSVYYVAVSNKATAASWDAAEKDSKLIAEFWQDWITIYPICVDRTSSEYLLQKHRILETITFDWNDRGLPRSPDEVREFFESYQPAGFIKYLESGLGIERKYRVLLSTLQQLGEVRHLVLSKDEESRVDGEVFYLNLQEFQTLRKALNRIVRKYQREALEDKQLLAYSNLLHRYAPDRFLLKVKKTKDGEVLKDRTAILDRKDQRAAIDLLSRSTNDLAKNEPRALLQLKSEIEHVSLGRLIDKFEEMLTKQLTEPYWQQFFKDNSFALSLAFAYPVLLVKSQAYVGRSCVDGSGTKIADYLFASRFTGNLALFEIKRPDAELLRPVEYRANVYHGSKELSGAIAQVQDQKFELQNDFMQLAYKSKWTDFHPFAVHGFVLIGRNLEGRDQKKSFEFLRNALKDVNVITYDELLEKLKVLYKMLGVEQEQVASNSGEISF
jgi:hypothetical protein